MAAASKWRLIRSPRELRSSRMDYIQNIAIGTSSARTKTSSSFFFFFNFLVPLCIQKMRDDDVWHGGYYAGMKRVHVVFLLSKRSGVTLCWILDRFNRVCFRTDAIFDDDTTISNRIEKAYGFFFSILNHPRDFNALSVDGTFPIRVSSRVTLENTSVEDSFTFRGHFLFARWHANDEYEIFIFKNLNGQTAHSSTTSRVSKRLKKWEKRVVTDQILLSFTLK